MEKSPKHKAETTITSKLPGETPGTRELTDQELDKVSGGFLSKLAPPKPTSTTVSEAEDYSFD